MKRIVLVGLLLAAIALSAVAYAQMQPRKRAARQRQQAPGPDQMMTKMMPMMMRMMPAQGVIHENHLIVIRGGMIYLYDLPELNLVKSVSMPALQMARPGQMKKGMMKGGTRRPMRGGMTPPEGAPAPQPGQTY